MTSVLNPKVAGGRLDELPSRQMMSEPTMNTRYHGLDLLRAGMMLLGIVVHVSISYLIRIDGGPPVPWPYVDPDHSHLAAALVSFIHMFRMPAFFLIAGFFAGLLIAQRGRSEFLTNRFMRLLVPLVIGWILLWPLTMIIGLFGMTLNDVPAGQRSLMAVVDQVGERFALNSITSHHIGQPQSSVIAIIESARQIQSIPPREAEHTDLLHLWFLHHLFLYCVLTIPIAWFLARPAGSIRTKVQRLVREVTIGRLRWLRIPLLGSLTFVLLLQSRDGTGIDTRAGFIPDPLLFIIYLFFFLIGWVFYAHRELIGEIKTGAWYRTIGGTCLLLGAMTFTIVHVLLGVDPTTSAMPPEFRGTLRGTSFIASQLLQSFGFWLFVLGIIGLAERAFQNASPLVRYLVDASYWIYLAHLPLAMLLPTLMHDTRMPGILKMTISIILVTIPLLVTYHFFVRATVIGRLLNGRKYHRALPWRKTANPSEGT